VQCFEYGTCNFTLFARLDRLLIDCQQLRLNKDSAGVCFRYVTFGHTVRTVCETFNINSGKLNVFSKHYLTELLRILVHLPETI